MRKLLLIAGVAALILPGAALAQDDNMKPQAGMTPDAGDYGADVAYSGAPDDVAAREAWFDHQIHRHEAAGEISDYDAMHDRQLLASVRRQQDELRTEHDGLTADDQANLNTQLDGLKARLNTQLGEIH